MRENDLQIRTAGRGDLKLLAALGVTTCYEAYFELDPSDALAAYCALAFNLEQLKTELDDPAATFLIAETRGRAVGYAKLREGKTVECLAGRHAIEVQRIYLLEKVKGRGFGRLLLERCRELGRAKGYAALWLGVWEKNVGAQRFYERMGMKCVGETDFSDGANEFINHVYAVDL
ncbi:MAG: GNAT family N-acetyltransferase [Acidobacteria bacterium]|nr:GNAT family N-acetyltransferase [Acidobacteriota bacterium]